MQPELWRKIERLYYSALALEANQRAAYLAQACGDDAALRQQVEALLAQTQGTDSFLEKPAAALAAKALMEAAGGTAITPAIGRYRIVRLLGEGGMGAVYEAQQDQPRRIVALKVVKPGFATAETLRRFQQESQALGRLQHPGIAQIHEAGTADTGFGPQPYFAMELIRGQALLEYAEAQRLHTRDRLALMAKICDAVDHAHQRGVIHRDLKPGNILVDETGQPKILDFGVARVTEGEAPNTRQTDLGQLVGTLAYMSPEQVAGDPNALDLRSDVYALGVITYELLAGKLPYNIGRKPLPEVVAIIREEEPAPLSSIDRRYRGDIGTIVAKALEKDKARRYGSAADLAADIRRYLADKPITARPASAAYQLQKFARRHKALVAATVVVFVVLAAGVVASTREAVRARTAEATAQAVNDFLQHDLLAQASANRQSNPSTRPDPDLRVRTALDRAAARIAGRLDKQPEVEAAIRDTIGQTYMDLGLYPEARAQLSRALELFGRVRGPKDPQTLNAMGHLGLVAHLQGNYAQAEVLYTRTIEIQRRVLGPDHPDTLASMSGLSGVYLDQAKFALAEALESQTLERRRRVLGPEHPDTLSSMTNLAHVYYWLGKYEQAEALDRQALEISRRVLGPEHPDTLESMNNLAIVYQGQRKYLQAEALFSEILDIRRRVLGPEHSSTLNTHLEFAALYQRQGKYALAETHASQALAGYRHVLGPDQPPTIDAAALMAQSCLWEGKFAETERLAREVLEADRKVRPDHWQRFAAEILLGASLSGQKKYPEAEPLLLEGYSGMLARKERMGPATWHYLELARGLIVRFYEAWGRPDKAAQWRQSATP
ncbi:MAG TPA: serine/threonine-protein kinase [Bryobacteraceae bacterium]|nr:serine/threonine-protein kinase [Bryobacteraceae bacterium]